MLAADTEAIAYLPLPFSSQKFAAHIACDKHVCCSRRKHLSATYLAHCAKCEADTPPQTEGKDFARQQIDIEIGVLLSDNGMPVTQSSESADLSIWLMR